jgi:hypothetical protein
MKLSENTIEILKNYATINMSLLFRPGSTIRTIAIQKNVFSKSEVVEDFPVEFGIFDLNQFLATVALFEDPDLAFGDRNVTISDNDSTTKYWYCDKSIITVPPKKNIDIGSRVSFKLTKIAYDKLRNAAGVLGLGDFVIRSNENEIVAEVFDRRNPTSNSYSLVVGENTTGATFEFHILVERLKMLSKDWIVDMDKKDSNGDGWDVVKFSNKDLEYWIALEPSSTYEG